MDEIVVRALAKWPNVPAAYDWLKLDRRGNWLVKTRPQHFDVIANPAFADFIGRNYDCDGDGCWYFQNGPQRVFVTLDYTPWVFRLDDRGSGVVTHTGKTPKALNAVFVDDDGTLLFQTDIGIGVLLDRDLLPLLTGAGDKFAALLTDTLASGREQQCDLFGKRLPVSSIRAAEVGERFGFVARPRPAAGEPDC